MDWTPELRDLVRRNLSSFQRHQSASTGHRAAVAIVLLRGPQGEASLPMFLRSSRLRRHAGQMGLPGGRLDEAEDAPTAALRELHEELGIVAGFEAILGALDDFETRSGFVIIPFVLWSEVGGRALRPAAAEIARLYLPTLRELQTAVAASSPGASEAFSLGFRWGEVYAPTAAILYQFSEVALSGRPCRVDDFYQPPFTWR